jgi:hypothetical protein
MTLGIQHQVLLSIIDHQAKLESGGQVQNESRGYTDCHQLIQVLRRVSMTLITWALLLLKKVQTFRKIAQDTPESS